MKSNLPLAGLSLMLAGIPVTAHRNFAAEYDASATVTGSPDWSFVKPQR